MLHRTIYVHFRRNPETKHIWSRKWMNFHIPSCRRDFPLSTFLLSIFIHTQLSSSQSTHQMFMRDRCGHSFQLTANSTLDSLHMSWLVIVDHVKAGSCVALKIGNLNRFSKLVTDRISIENSFIWPEIVSLSPYFLDNICSVFFL